MKKIRWRGAARPLFWRVAAALVTAVCLAAVLQLASIKQAERRRLAALRAEQQRIAAELEAVKRIASDSEPVVVLEDGRGTRVIVDLDSAIRPASHRTYD